MLAVRTLARCDRLAWALGQLADQLELAIDEGKSVNGDQVFEELARIVEAHERFVLAERCLLAALAGHRQARTRHVVKHLIVEPEHIDTFQGRRDQGAYLPVARARRNGIDT